VAYLEKEVQGQWFSLDREDVPTAEVVATLDKNKRNLNRAADKYYQVVLAPSQAELRHIDSDPEKLRAYTRAAMEQYAANFGKGIEGRDLVYFAKVEHERTTNYQDRAVQLGNVAEGQTKPGLQTHIHIIVSRTENLVRYAERKKLREMERKNPYHLSPLTNHKNTERGVVTGGFERKQYSELVEQAFDQAFAYERPLVETFRYAYLMQHGTPEECATLRVQAIQEQQLRAEQQQRQAEQEQQRQAELKQQRQAELEQHQAELEQKRQAEQKATLQLALASQPSLEQSQLPQQQAEPELDAPEQRKVRSLKS
jgi:hypothetical protein